MAIYTLYWHTAVGNTLSAGRTNALGKIIPWTNEPGKVNTTEQLNNGVKYHGWLSVKGTRLVNSRGESIQLRGLSSHGLMWYPEYTNYRAMETIKNHGANVFRLAMYTEPKNGYIQNPDLTKKILYSAVENVLAADMYAIVDWHILEDSNPNTYIRQAKEFFHEVSRQYADEPGVIYEICNEPSGDTTWADVSKYANAIIPIIRKNAPNAIILVGTPKYCTDLESVIDRPLAFRNIMYTYHFYTHKCKGGYNNSLTTAMDNNLPVFVSEWGLHYQPGSNIIDYDKATEFLNFLKQNKISWVNWSLSNKDEVYSVLKSSSTELSGWTKNDLTDSGQFIFKQLTLD